MIMCHLLPPPPLRHPPGVSKSPAAGGEAGGAPTGARASGQSVFNQETEQTTEEFSKSILYLLGERSSPRVKQAGTPSPPLSLAGTTISRPRLGPAYTASSPSIQAGHQKTPQVTRPGSDGPIHCPKSQIPGPGPAMEPREQRTHSPRRLAFSLDSVGTVGKARPAADSRGTRGAGRLSQQRVRAPGAHQPCPGLRLSAESPSPFRSRSPPDLRAPQSREALEDTLRGHLLKRLHSFTSDLRQHLPGSGLGPQCPPPGCGSATLQPTPLLRRWAEPHLSLSNKSSFLLRLTCKQSNH